MTCSTLRRLMAVRAAQRFARPGLAVSAAPEDGQSDPHEKNKSASYPSPRPHLGAFSGANSTATQTPRIGGAAKSPPALHGPPPTNPIFVVATPTAIGRAGAHPDTIFQYRLLSSVRKSFSLDVMVETTPVCGISATPMPSA